MRKNVRRREFMSAGVTAMGAGFLYPSGGEAAPAQAGYTSPVRGLALSSFDAQLKPVLASMTLDEKIGQMTQAEQNALKDVTHIETYFLGSLLSGGSSDPKAGNGLEAWTEMYDGYQSHALKTRLGIPILFGVDAVHGHNNVLNATVFPHNIGLGCTRNEALVERASRVTAEEVRATGINWAFAPCVAVPRDERWGRAYEGYGEEPDLARALGAAAVRGLQKGDLSHPLSVLACAKHFVGDGGTTMGTGKERGSDKKRILDQGDTRMSEAELRRLHLGGYVAAIAAGVGSIMPSYSSWNGVKVSGSRRLLTEMLKDELRFEGFLISDYAAIDQITSDYKEAIAISINAGMDMVMVPNEYVKFITLLKEAVNEGTVPMSRIDDAVTRILRVKFAMGLMDRTRSPLADRTLHKTFGSAAHRTVARDCVRQSMVLLKNEKNILPLSKSAARIHVAGRCADDIGNQCGGWTIDWQGKSGDIMTGGTSILSALRAAVASPSHITFARDGSDAVGASVGIVIAGETPYAEGAGDTEDLSLAKEDVTAVRAFKAAGVPVILILISGRPLVISDVLSDCHAVIAAWLPGTEGGGVADVLFGDYKPTGKLSCSWPRSMAQVPLNVGDRPYDPLFAYGFGLTY